MYTEACLGEHAAELPPFLLQDLRVYGGVSALVAHGLREAPPVCPEGLRDGLA